MPVHNADLAAVFEEIADRLEIEGANPFRIRAYRNAARQLQAMGVAVADMVAKGEELSELPEHWRGSRCQDQGDSRDR